jgi:ABC-type bacteriocin/lantibiotic exporter with double-glycine peptidase domain
VADRRRRQRLFVPEVIQTSAMDCGPAALKCLLEGYGIHASYGRLREACQTDVDGTSIDTLEDTAVQLGLDAEQIVVPVDHVLLPGNSILPALIVVRLPDGVTHFVVAWRTHGPMVQVMDPGVGRRWVTRRRFLADLYVHETVVPAQAWREWAASRATLSAIERRLAGDGIKGAAVARILESAASDQGWRALASADAAGRMTAALVRSKGIAGGSEATQVFERVFARAHEQASRDESGVERIVPRPYWSAWPAAPDEAGREQIAIRGAVAVSVRGIRSEPSLDATKQKAPLPPELVRALEEPPVRPWRTLLDLLSREGVMAPGALALALAVATLGVVGEALLFRGLFSVGAHLSLGGQRALAAAALVLLIGVLLLLEFPIAASSLRFGRRLEARLRMAFLQKIPRLGDRYFQSRPASDMAERSHSIHQIRLLPDLGVQAMRTLFELILTTIGIAWIDPGSAPLAVLSTMLALTLPFLAQPVLRERDLRLRTHTGALGRFYLDAFLGLVAVRTHGAEPAMRREHEGLLVEWARAALGLQRAAVTVEGLQLFIGFGLAGLLLFGRLGRGGDPGGALLIAYWALNLPTLGQELAHAAWQYPTHRNLMLRLIEPLGSLEDEPSSTAPDRRAGSPAPPSGTRGVSINFDAVNVRAAGHLIVQDVTVAISPGEHVAVVGASGAGKSSLVGMLLGWHRPSTGSVTIDGDILDGSCLDRLRRETAWVDPSVQLWNRSLLANLTYGHQSSNGIGAAIDAADLSEVLEHLPDGLQTPLGEGGGSLSGGEGQRVRLARAVLRPHARLVILDEPFRGLERERRRELLKRARTLWKDATLICVTHDVGETQAFGRVFVVSDGRVVEDGSPASLESSDTSRYRAMLDADRSVRENLWSQTAWRTLTMTRGRLTESRAGDPA